MCQNGWIANIGVYQKKEIAKINALPKSKYCQFDGIPKIRIMQLSSYTQNECIVKRRIQKEMYAQSWDAKIIA